MRTGASERTSRRGRGTIAIRRPAIRATSKRPGIKTADGDPPIRIIPAGHPGGGAIVSSFVNLYTSIKITIVQPNPRPTLCQVARRGARPRTGCATIAPRDDPRTLGRPIAVHRSRIAAGGHITDSSRERTPIPHKTIPAWCHVVGPGLRLCPDWLRSSRFQAPRGPSPLSIAVIDCQNWLRSSPLRRSAAPCRPAKMADGFDRVGLPSSDGLQHGQISPRWLASRYRECTRVR